MRGTDLRKPGDLLFTGSLPDVFERVLLHLFGRPGRRERAYLAVARKAIALRAHARVNLAVESGIGVKVTSAFRRLAFPLWSLSAAKVERTTGGFETI